MTTPRPLSGIKTAVGQIVALLAERARDATICPSEVARRLVHDSAHDWRDDMPVVHEAVDHLMAQGKLALSWKGQRLAGRSGAYRIGRGPRYESATIASADPNAD